MFNKIEPIQRAKTSINLSIYNSSKLNLFRLKGTVIKHVLPKSIFFAIWSTAICLVDWHVRNKYKTNISVPNTLITILGTFISLLLVFRTNTAYDRYWEGRKVWSTMKVCLRNLARLTWLHCEELEPKDRAIKEHIINLLISFAVFTKHHLRQEYDIDYSDCEGLMHIFPTPLATRDHTPDSTVSPFTYGDKDFLAIEIKESIQNSDSHNFPLMIIQRLSAFIAFQVDTNRVSVPVQGVLINTLTTLTDCLTGFERILYTPIPIAYSVHLSQSLWVFCLLLPFQLLNMSSSSPWLTIPFTVISTFVLFGILNIGEEIENPFGYDLNDLPLDDYCVTIRKELEGICKLSSNHVMLSSEDGFKFNLVHVGLANDKVNKINKYVKEKRKKGGNSPSGTSSKSSTFGKSSKNSTFGKNSNLSSPQSPEPAYPLSNIQSKTKTADGSSAAHADGSGGTGGGGGGGDE